MQAASLDLGPEQRISPAGSFRRSIGGFLRKQPLGAFAATVLGVFVLLAVFPGVVTLRAPNAISPSESLQAPSLSHPFGTDNFGRDQFSRVVAGARVSMVVGFGAVTFGITIATIVGVTVGYAGGYVDMIVQRFVDALMGFPPLVLALAAVGFLRPGVLNVTLVIGFVMIAGASRVVRSATLAVKQRPYVEAARSTGAGARRILIRHLLPNISAPIIVVATVGLGSAILAESSLSFLGLGVPPPEPSWGRMLGTESRLYFARSPWLAIFPGVALSAVVFSFNMLGDALRDTLDPRVRRRGT